MLLLHGSVAFFLLFLVVVFTFISFHTYVKSLKWVVGKLWRTLDINDRRVLFQGIWQYGPHKDFIIAHDFQVVSFVSQGISLIFTQFPLEEKYKVVSTLVSSIPKAVCTKEELNWLSVQAFPNSSYVYNFCAGFIYVSL